MKLKLNKKKAIRITNGEDDDADIARETTNV